MNQDNEEKMIDAIRELAAAVREQANQAKRLADLHDRLWLALPPRARAKILGVSSRTEQRIRKRIENEMLFRAVT